MYSRFQFGLAFRLQPVTWRHRSTPLQHTWGSPGRRLYAIQPSVHGKGNSEAESKSEPPLKEDPSSEKQRQGNVSQPPQVPPHDRANLDTGHARFIAEADLKDDWHDGKGNAKIGGAEGTGKEIKGLEPGKGKLSPTSTHLFKLILPLPSLRSLAIDSTTQPPPKPAPPTVFLLHPSQPLSHVSRLIQASLPTSRSGKKAPAGYPPSLPAITFESRHPQSLNSTYDSISPTTSSASDEVAQDEAEDLKKHVEGNDEAVQWSESTDIGDFVKEAARSTEFFIVLRPGEDSEKSWSSQEDQASKDASSTSPDAWTIPVTVPSFEDRTHFLRRRLAAVDKELVSMQDIKNSCDTDAHRGAKRVAIGGFAILVTYWLAVLRMTFFTDLGWDVMEPVTYLTEFLFILGGYMWFLYQGREVSYSSILNRSVSSRRNNLYVSRGLDIDKWADLVTEQKALRKEISRIKEDYDAGWKEGRKSDKDEVDEERKDAEISVTKGEPVVGSKIETPKEENLLKEADVVEERRKKLVDQEEKSNPS